MTSFSLCFEDVLCITENESEGRSAVSDSVWPPWTIQSMGFSRPEYWSREPFPSPGDLPDPGIEPGSLSLQAILYWLSYQVSVSLVLTYLIIMCFGIIFSMFLMLGIHWASWICGFILFISFGENSLIVSSNISPLFPLFLCFWGFHLHIYHTCVSYIQEPILVSHLTKQTCTWLLADESVGRGGLDPSAINMFHCSLLNGGNALLRQGSAPPVRSTMVATHPPVAMELWTVASRLSVKLHFRSWSLTPKIGMQNALLIML